MMLKVLGHGRTMEALRFRGVAKVLIDECKKPRFR